MKITYFAVSYSHFNEMKGAKKCAPKLDSVTRTHAYRGVSKVKKKVRKKKGNKIIAVAGTYYIIFKL